MSWKAVFAVVWAVLSSPKPYQVVPARTNAQAVQLQRAAGGVRAPGAEGERVHRRLRPVRGHQNAGQDGDQDDEESERPARALVR
ncbi:MULTISPECIES: hypothetical protein [Amycolatopsis]|uniref:Secreted protein n=1 Tax=Amycolatopsis bullii TaxID=941987 RepID=A0ABQ3K6J9_9PSEU|nr:hypothetical protein [Amycolatopsis bullii]GHG02429.1 hypothetical protein GCM10017567_17060 [Amycolatopsis bullii]